MTTTEGQTVAHHARPDCYPTHCEPDNPCPRHATPEDLSTPDLVREFAASRVWFAVNETVGPVAEGFAKHRRHRAIVDVLRQRGVLD